MDFDIKIVFLSYPIDSQLSKGAFNIKKYIGGIDFIADKSR